MSDEGIKIFEVTDYLDVWRGAFYSIILGLIYQVTVTQPQI